MLADPYPNGKLVVGIHAWVTINTQPIIKYLYPKADTIAAHPKVLVIQTEAAVGARMDCFGAKNASDL